MWFLTSDSGTIKNGNRPSKNPWKVALFLDKYRYLRFKADEIILCKTSTGSAPGLIKLAISLFGVPFETSSDNVEIVIQEPLSTKLSFYHQ